MNRLSKQLLYGLFFLAIIGAIVWGLYRAVVPAPTCTDGVQNGGEEGVDCGAVCGNTCPPVLLPLDNKGVQLIHNANGSWDALAHLENPNGIYGASRVGYLLDVKDAAGADVATRTGFTYVNPAQPQYLDFPLGTLAAGPTSASLQFDPSQVQWAALTVQAAGTVQFAVRGDMLSSSSAGTHYTATVTNKSSFDFDEVDVTVLLEDASGTVIGAGSTVMRTMVSGETRGITLDWPFSVPGAVNTQVFVGTNLFSNANYLKTYGSPERVQGN
ncbi:MAG TPA: FxLYD domain-containing protein [Candidatus Paceibacterota bacterium]|nr:FxLYD domain-containing protein [Candidatus Paceibacterota bacterium]